MHLFTFEIAHVKANNFILLYLEISILARKYYNICST